MPPPKVSESVFVDSIKTIGIAATVKKYDLDPRNAARRRRFLEGKYGPIESPYEPVGGRLKANKNYPGRVPLSVKDGVVIVAGDPHYWPGDKPLMHRALVLMLKRFRQERKLRAVIMNGDVCDFASISHWPMVNWEKRPSVQEEIETCIERMDELAEAAGRAPRYWPLGNHDARFSIFLAQHAREFAKLQGFQLKDHFPLWEPCWSVEINENTIVKHSYRSGIHAAYNNVLHSGMNMVTNHLHSAKVYPFDDYNGTRWGVDTGCIADTNGAQFLYMQDNPRNWRNGFAVLTYESGQLMPPELVLSHPLKDDCVIFRGETIKV